MKESEESREGVCRGKGRSVRREGEECKEKEEIIEICQR